ncbi:MAG TPA: hypothetical protein VD794_00070 [Flavisolibacter sp.]|nr:hypothetical protein [Flavisolibacter sp.]
MSFEYYNLNPATPLGIQEAIDNKQPFGLVAGSKRNVVIFSVAHLASWWVLNDGTVQASYTYAGMKQFMEAISMQLYSHRDLVEPKLLLQSKVVGLIEPLRTLGYPNT